MLPLEVTWIPDQTIRPPGPKMVVCIEPNLGWFFRINSRPHWRPCIPLVREPHHRFLDHDSYLECNILDLDEYLIEEAVRESGVIGQLHIGVCGQIREAIRQNSTISNGDKAAIHAQMQALER